MTADEWNVATHTHTHTHAGDGKSVNCTSGPGCPRNAPQSRLNSVLAANVYVCIFKRLNVIVAMLSAGSFSHQVAFLNEFSTKITLQ